MNRTVLAALAIGMVAGGASGLLAQVGAPPPPPQEGIPGRGTQARVLVINHDRTEAVPVSLVDAEPIRAVVRIDSEAISTVRTLQARQSWEYRTLSMNAATGDPAAMLTAAGSDGWELTGTVPGAGGATLLVLKRPR